jgi:hypothetical protein
MPYWRYRRRSRNYGRERASRHIREAEAFSREVVNTDGLVKRTFFSLSGRALQNLLDSYEQLYGADARQYAAQTIPKWRSGQVQMSGMVAKRLFDLLPPFMPAADKNKIVEAIWRAYGPRSNGYLYVGPDSESAAVELAIQAYFDRLQVQYPIPDRLRAQFRWLAQDDAAATERLLNHFMGRQRELALESARLHLPLLIESVKADTDERISRMAHTIEVGNHVLEIRADRYRHGFFFSELPYLYERAPFKMGVGGWVIIAAIAVIAVLWIASIISGSPNSRTGVSPAPPGQAASLASPSPIVHTSKAPTAAKEPTIAVKPARIVVKRQSILRTPLPSQLPVGSGSVVVTVPARQVSQPATSADPCSVHSVAWVEPDGSSVVTSDGSEYSVSDDVARIQAASWSTGEDVRACSEEHGATLQVGFNIVQVQVDGSAAVENGTCRSLYIGYANPDGSEVRTTDGSTFTVANDVQKIIAATWITGDSAQVCSMRVNGTWRASLTHGFNRVQTRMESIGSGDAITPRCSEESIESSDSGSMIRITDGTYRVDNDVMQIQAQSLAAGSGVTVCSYVANGIRYVGLIRGFERIEGARSQ